MTMDETTPDNIRKVPASAGAQWLIDGFALLKASPGGFGVMGVAYGVFAVIATMALMASPVVGAFLLGVLMLVAPMLMGGLVWAAREVSQGRQVGITTYLEPMRQGKVGALLTIFAAQFAAALTIVLLLYAMVGQDGARTMAIAYVKIQSLPPGAQPDPALLATLPAGRVLLWMLISLLIGIASFLMTFIAIPAVMLGNDSGVAALRRSWHGSVRNLPAVIVFIIVLFVAMIGISLLAGLLGAVAGMIAGQFARMVVAQIAMTTIMVPAMWGAIAKAWQSMFAGETVPPPMPTGQLQA